MSTLVMKFGGTSVGSVEAIRQTTAIIRGHRPHWDHLVVVVSAMSGVTDTLLRCGKAAAAGDTAGYASLIADLRHRHHDVAEALAPAEERTSLMSAIDQLLDNLRSLCECIRGLGEATPRSMDAIASIGERLNARIVAAALRSLGLSSEAVDATEIIVTDDHFQNAAPLMELTRERAQARLLPLLSAGVIPVVTGFIGATREGVITTLGRGASDYTASILGSCLDADEVWIWTDVDGVMTADPRIVPDAHTISVLSYREISEMAYFGARVLHPKSALPVLDRGIPLRVKNTFNPARPGTLIVREPESADGRVKGVTAIRGLSLITVEGRGMIGVPGIAARTFSTVARCGASALMISQASSEQSICFVIPTPIAPAVIRALEEEMAWELQRRDIDRIWSLDNVVIVTAIGARLRDTPGIAARIFGALGRASINILAIAQGSSECSISMVVMAQDADEAVRQIHREVIQ